MNSILKQELLGLKNSVNYWLGISWILAILIAIIAIAITITRKNINPKDQIIKNKNDDESGKGFYN